MYGNRTPLGTAALRADSTGSDPAAGPWLAALLTAEAHRRRGIGTAPVAVVEAEAQRLGFPAVCVSGDTAETLFRRRGWDPVGQTRSLRGAVIVWRKVLAS